MVGTGSRYASFTNNFPAGSFISPKLSPRSQTLFGNANLFATLLPRTRNKVREQNPDSRPPACHVERSETSLLICARPASRNGQRCFALLRMTGPDGGDRIGLPELHEIFSGQLF